MKGIFVAVINVSLASMFFTLLLQQVVLVNSAWAEKIEEMHVASDQYARSCVGQRHDNQKIARECTNLKLIMEAHPFVRAISAVIMSWKTCVTMDCGDLVRLVWSNYEYKILFILVLSGFLYYLTKFVGIAHEKGVTMQDYFRKQQTKIYLKGKYGGTTHTYDHFMQNFEDEK